MRNVHFFKARSRIGIMNPHSTQRGYDDFGVENGADAILTGDFLKKFPGYDAGGYSFSKPEEIEPDQFYTVLGREVGEFRESVHKHLKPGQTQVVLGGDHSVTLPSVLAVRDRIGGFKNLGYVQFDSHGDMNSRASSPTGNFHGMYARPLVDRIDIPEIENLVPDKLPVENTMYVGNLGLDPGETGLFEKKKIKNITGEALLKDKSGVIEDFKNFVLSFRYLHVTFDIDVLSKAQAPATGIPAENGLMFEDIKELLRIISRHPDVSFDLTEVNPQKDGIERTVQTAQKVLSASLLT